MNEIKKIGSPDAVELSKIAKLTLALQEAEMELKKFPDSQHYNTKVLLIKGEIEAEKLKNQNE